nr:hypothetical protein [Rhodobacter sp.]
PSWQRPTLTVTDTGDGTYSVRLHVRSGHPMDRGVAVTVAITLEEDDDRRRLENIDIDGSAEPDSHFDLAAERTFDLAGRILDATGGVIPSDWTDVEYTALTFTLSGHADLVGSEAWDAFIAANFEDGAYLGGAPDLSMFGALTETETITLNLATVEAAITGGTVRELPANLDEFDADTWEDAFQTFMAPTGEGGRRLNVWEEEFSEFWEAFVDVAVPGSSEASASGATSYAYGVAPTVAAGAGEVGLATALGGAGLVIGAELLIAYVAVQAFRTIQHEYKIPVYGIAPTADLEPVLESKLAIAQLAITPEGGRDEAWAEEMAEAVQAFLDADDVDGAVEFLRDIETSEGARGAALVFTALDPQSAQQVSESIVAGMASDGRIPPSSKYIDVVIAERDYSALEDLAFGIDARLYSTGEGIARTDGALTARNVETINNTAGSAVIADILSVLTVQEFASPGASNIDGFIGLTTRLATDGTSILNEAARFMAGRRDGSSEALMQVLISDVYPDLPVADIFYDANTDATAHYYEIHFGEDGSEVTPEGYDETFTTFASLTSAADRAAYFVTLPVDRQITLLESLSIEEATSLLVAVAGTDGGIDSLTELLNAADKNVASGILIVLANSDPETTATILAAASENPVANARLLDAAADVSTFVLGVIDPTDFVAVIETLAASGTDGADLATRMLNGFSNQEIAAVLTLFEDPAARAAIFASDTRRENFVEPDQLDLKLGIVDDDTRSYADTLLQQVESGELTPEEAGQLFFLHLYGIHPPVDQNNRRQNEATPEWADQQIEDLVGGDTPIDPPSEITEDDAEFAEAVGNGVIEATDDLIAEHGGELQRFAEEAEVGDTLEMGGYVFVRAEPNLIQVQMRVRYNNIPDGADPTNPGSGTGKALFVWGQFDRNQLIDGSVENGNFDFQVVIRPHVYGAKDIKPALPPGLSFTAFVELGGEVELNYSSRRGEDGGRITRLNEIKAGFYALPGTVISDALRYLPRAAAHVLGYLWDQGTDAQRAEVVSAVGMLGLGLIAGAQDSVSPQARNLLIGEAVRSFLSFLPYAAQVTSAITPAEVSALGEAVVDGIQRAYRYFNPTEELEIEADLESLGSGVTEDGPEVEVTVTQLAIGGVGDEGDVEMVEPGARGRAQSILLGGQNDRGEVVDITDPTSLPGLDNLLGIGDGNSDDSSVEAEAGSVIAQVGSTWSRAVEWVAQSFESRTLALFYLNGFTHWVNDDIVPGQEPDDFRGGWNGDYVPDYLSGTAAFVVVTETELTYRDRTTQQGWQLGLPRVDFVDPVAWVVQKPISEEGRLVLEQSAGEDNVEIRNP